MSESKSKKSGAQEVLSSEKTEAIEKKRKKKRKNILTKIVVKKIKKKIYKKAKIKIYKIPKK